MAELHDWVELGKDTISSLKTKDVTNLYSLEWPETRKMLIADYQSKIDSDPKRLRRFARMHSAMLLGVARRLAPFRRLLFLVAFAAWEWRVPTTPRFGFGRDLGHGLNHYWTPRGVTTFLIICGVAWVLALSYWLMRLRGWELPWLVTLGQTALPLYFIHQLIEETLIHRTLGLRFNNWIVYWSANVALIVLCVYVGRAWLAVKPRVRALAGLATA